MAVALNDLVQRLQANVSAGLPDMADAPMKVPASGYADPAQYRLEMERIFLKVPLLVALSCDVREPGDFLAYDLASRPIIVVRGDDGQVRTFLNVCRHRGARLTDEHCGSARRFTCPYHAWSYDSGGALVGVPGKDSFGEIGATGLLELPTEERVGAVFSCLDSVGHARPRHLAGRLRRGPRHPPPRRAASLPGAHHASPARTGSWRPTATSTGTTSGTSTGTPSVARPSPTGTPTTCSGPTCGSASPPRRRWSADEAVLAAGNPPDYFSLVHYVFPNVSISGGHGDTLMLSKLLPGATVDRSTTVQFQYYREPVVGDMVAVAEEKRQTYEAVVRDEDCATIFGINDGLAAVGDGHFVFGRNEPANQQLHRTIARLTHDT